MHRQHIVADGHFLVEFLADRAYSAQRILDGLGCTDVKFLDGSWTAWPYELDWEPKKAPR